MKKVLSLVLCLGLVLGIAGCGNSNKQKEQNKKEYVSKKDINKVYSNPEEYAGMYIKLTGKVFTQPEVDDGIYFQMWANPKNNDLNTIVQYSNTDFELKEDDYVSVDGLILGENDGENAFGGSISSLKIKATNVKISSYIDVVSPTIKKVTPQGLTNNQNGVDITVTKVEFAKNETRLYYTVTNNSGSKYSFYDFNMKIIQNGKQIEKESNYEANYPSLSGDILNGISSEGIVSFPALDQSNFDIYFEAGYSDNYDLDFNEFTLSVTIQ